LLTKITDALSWYSQELAELQASPLVNVRLYKTRPSGNFLMAQHTPSFRTSDVEKHLPISISLKRVQDIDIEKHASTTSSPVTPTSRTITPWDSTTSLNVVTGRPDIEALVREIVGSAGEDERIAIAACGPHSLMSTVRRVSAEAIRVKGPSVELHCEQFGW
jgi:hypothetical protein